MFRNYLKISLRNLLRNKTFSFINIFGLAIGMACFILITTWIRQEMAMDQFHEKRDRIFRLMTNLKESKGVATSTSSPVVVGKHLKEEFPEIEQIVVTGWQESRFLEVDGQKHRTSGLAVEPGFLKMFTYPLVKGRPDEVLNDIHSIVITETLAEKLFGKEDPVGRSVKLNNKDHFTVTGVLKDLPETESANYFFQYLISYKYFLLDKQWMQDDGASVQTFVELKPGASVEAMSEKIKNLPVKYGEKNLELFLHPLTRWYLNSNFENGQEAGGRIETVRFFGIIAVFILLIACVNFTNLSTVQSEKRAKEVGIRKVIGVKKKHLILQFLGESLLMAFFAGLAALIIVVLSIDPFYSLTGNRLYFDFKDPLLISSLPIFIVITGTIAGVYPAFFLSSFKPILILKGRILSANASFTPRRVLVVFQFSFAITMVISAIIVKKQIDHAQARDNGYSKDKLVYYQYYGGIENYPLLRNQLLSTGIASSVTHSSAPITDVWDVSPDIEWQGKRPEQITEFKILCADGSLQETFGVKLLEGRSFDLLKYPSDSTACMINEKALATMGIKNPVGQTINYNGMTWKIAGVVKDFILGSPYVETAPLIILGAKGWFNVVHIKLSNKKTVNESVSATNALFKKLNPSFPFESAFVDQEYARKFEDEKRISALAALFTGLSILISLMGLFGLATYTAQSRIREIGIRKVLGASVADIHILLTKDLVKLLTIAICIASPLAFVVMQNWLGNYEYRISIPLWIFPLSGLLAIVLALITVAVISIKAAITNPSQSLASRD